MYPDFQGSLAGWCPLAFRLTPTSRGSRVSVQSICREASSIVSPAPPCSGMQGGVLVLTALQTAPLLVVASIYARRAPQRAMSLWLWNDHSLRYPHKTWKGVSQLLSLPGV